MVALVTFRNPVVEGYPASKTILDLLLVVVMLLYLEARRTKVESVGRLDEIETRVGKAMSTVETLEKG